MIHQLFLNHIYETNTHPHGITKIHSRKLEDMENVARLQLFLRRLHLPPRLHHPLPHLQSLSQRTLSLRMALHSRLRHLPPRRHHRVETLHHRLLQKRKRQRELLRLNHQLPSVSHRLHLLHPRSQPTPTGRTPVRNRVSPHNRCSDLEIEPNPRRKRERLERMHRIRREPVLSRAVLWIGRSLVSRWHVPL